MSYWLALKIIALGQGATLGISYILRSMRSRGSDLFWGIFIILLAIETVGIWFPSLLLPAVLYLLLQSQRAGFHLSYHHILFFIPGIFQFSLVITINQVESTQIYYFFGELLPALSSLLIVLFSDRPGVLLNKSMWTKKTFRLHLMFFSCTIVCSLWTVLVIFQLPVYEFLQSIIILTILALAFHTYVFPDDKKAKRQRADEAFVQFDDNKTLERLNGFLERQKLYLDPHLSLKTLAAELEIPDRYLSYVINNYHHRHFRSYLNALRLRHVLSCVDRGEHKRKTLWAIAEESGFKSRSAFYAAFQREYGIAPAAYVKQTKKS
jgi:AraC-like DNA-binding protein